MADTSRRGWFRRRPTASAVALPAAPAAAEHHRSLTGDFTMGLSAFHGAGSWWGPGPYRGALAIPAAYRSATMLAGLLGSLPLHAYRAVRGGEDPPIRLYPDPPMLADPCPGVDTRSGAMRAWALDYLLDGNAIGIVAGRYADGTPSAFIPVPVWMVQVAYLNGSYVPSPTTIVNEVDGNDPGIYYRIGPLVFHRNDVLHVKGPCAPGDLRGKGVLELACGTFDLAAELDKQARGVAAGGVPTGLLKADPNSSITFDELVEAKAAWLAQQNVRTVAALAPGVDFVPLAWDAEQMQLVESRRFSDQQIAMMFGIPPRYLGMDTGGGLQYSTPELDSAALTVYTLDPALLVPFEDAFSEHLVRGTFARFNRDALLRTTTKDRYEAHQLALTAGFMTVNEVRRLENLPPLPEPVTEPEPEPDTDPLDDTAPDATDGDNPDAEGGVAA